ncbi:MAG TPA: CBS domain-containing protein, partial [Kofleriaceae bacterium]|nr:CBS domain-containing protein [Kofleriaceae bacterium]
MKLREIMRPVRCTVGRDQTLGTAERIMVRRRLRQLFVVDAGKLVGSISDGDVLRYRAKAKADEAWWRDPVWRAMQELALAAGPDDLVTAAGDRLVASRVDVLPV